MSDPALRALLWRLAGRHAFRLSAHNWYRWRRLILRCCGAAVDPRSRFRRSVRIDRPWNVRAEAQAMFGDDVVVRAARPIAVGARCVVSQFAVLSSERRGGPGPSFPSRAAPITIEDDCWIATDALVLGGSTVHRGAVVGARSLVDGEVPAWTVVTGEPAAPRGPRVLHEERD